MTISSSGSTAEERLFQNSFYVGMNLQNILYGFELYLYFKTIEIMLSRSDGAHKKSNIFYTIFSSIMLFLVTVWVSTRAIWGQEILLFQSAYWENNLSNWYLDWGTTSVVVLQLMTDCLMIHRCRIIWNSYRAIVIPVILWLSTLTLGVLVDWISSSSARAFSSSAAIELGLSCYTLSVFLNTTLTCMICYRILRHSKRVREDLGREYASSYFTIVAIVVESAIPCTLSGIAFLVSLGLGSATSVAFACVYNLMMCISPQMLILRVMMGRAWDKDTCGVPGSTLKFSPEDATESQCLESSGVGPRVRLQELSNAYTLDGTEGTEGTASISQV